MGKMSYLTNKNVNNGRQPEIDMSKAVCIILMIMLHAFDQLAHVNDGIMMTFLHSSAGFLGAGAFMICMGIGMRYSRHQDPMSNVIRGIALLTVSQLVNLLRSPWRR